MDAADNRNYSLMACSPGQGEGDLGNGIAAGHAYSVVEIHGVQTARGLERLLKIRNPWGRIEWKGDWSDNSALWTPALRQQVGSKVEDDGYFFMRFEDYVRSFSSTDIVLTSDDGVRTRILSDFTN